MSKVKALAVDVDGTLLSSRGTALPQTVEGLRQCAKQGLVIYLATARLRRLIFRDGETSGDVSFLKEGGVFYNGATACDPVTGERTHWPIPGPLMSEIVGRMEERGAGLQIALQFEERHHSFRLPISDADLRGWGFRRHELVPFDEAQGWDCSKIVAFGEGPEVQAAYNCLITRFSHELTVFRSDQGSVLQVTSSQATKETALRHLLGARGISEEEIIVFGDDTPDVGMLRAFPHSVAMGNASPSVKEAATHVTRSNDEDGIAYALRDYFGLL